MVTMKERFCWRV